MKQALLERKETKGSVIRARCGRDLKTLLSRASQMLDLDEADVIRIACKQYASRVVYQPEVLNGAR